MPRRIFDVGISKNVRIDPDGVADPGEHIGNRVSHHGGETFLNLGYQLAFFTPGIRPRLARFRKQMRQTPNFR